MYKIKNEKINTHKRLFIVLWGFVFIVCLLLGRLVYIQIVNAEFYQKTALGQWTREKMLAALRGSISDRNGNLLAQSGRAVTVIVKPKLVPVSERERIAKALSETLSITYEEVFRKICTKGVDQINVKRQISDEEYENLSKQNLQGVEYSYEPKRYYKENQMAAQLIGYTSLDGKGQEGLEARYDKYLSGTPGSIVREGDASGRYIPEGAAQQVPPTNGSNLTLTIDSVVQNSLDNACAEALVVNSAKSVQGIVMDPKTGEVLAMTTKPDFNLNVPPRDDLDLLRSLSRNRVVADAYEPGSTFKIITLASGLDAGVVTEASEFNCTGSKIVDGEKIKCWRRIPHGHETLAQGVQNSCNPVFMEIALRMDTDKFYEYLENFGFGQLTSVGITGESKGILRHKKYVRTVDLARIGFGQSVSVTPVQLATAVSAAVNGGNLVQPHVLKEISGPLNTVYEQAKPTVIRRVVSEETSAIVRKLLEGVVKDGSGRNCYIPGYRIGGKTGTAQKYVDGKISQNKYVASFVGIAPIDDPKYVVLILVDEPNITSQVFGSTVAAPYVRMVLYDLLKNSPTPIPEQFDESEKDLNMKIEVPDLRNTTLEEAKATLEGLGLRMTADGIGSVINQAPLPGAIVPAKTGILLYMSDPEFDQEDQTQIAVPDVMYKDVGAAYELLTNAGFKVNRIGDPFGTVELQSPEAGTMANPGETVNITMSSRESSD